MFATITKIVKHISCVQRVMFITSDELRKRALVHDDSKFEQSELKYYAAYERFPKGLEYGSREYREAEKRINVGIGSPGFNLHTNRNDHHPEHYDCPEQGINLETMGLFAIIEMVCDWAGAHLAYGNKGDWINSVHHNTDRHNFNEGQKWVIWEMSEFLRRRLSELQNPIK